MTAPATRSDEALAALTAAMTAAAAALGPLLDNATLGSAWTEVAGVKTFFNLRDGATTAITTMLGDGLPGDALYEIEHAAELEWVVQDSDADSRRAAFATGLASIDDVVRADRTLGGAVSHTEITRVERSNLTTDGVADVKAAIVTVTMTFTSPRPF